jgi:hypothetical protein
MRGGYLSRLANSILLRNTLKAATVTPDRVVITSEEHTDALLHVGVQKITLGQGENVNLWQVIDTAATARISKMRKAGMAVEFAPPDFDKEFLFPRLVTRRAKAVQCSDSYLEEVGAILGACGAAAALPPLHAFPSNGSPWLVLLNFIPMVAGGVYGYYSSMAFTATVALLYRLARFSGDMRILLISLQGGEVSEKRKDDIKNRLAGL